MKHKTFKILLSLFMVMVLSTNSFAIVLEDNDGSAFISKTEYDSLKNDFQEKLNAFNTSIDDKINDAIRAYLEAAVAKTKNKVNVTDLIASVESAWGKNILWTDATSLSDVCANVSRFCMQTTIAEASLGAVGMQAKGYCDTADHFLNGYTVLKKQGGKIVSRVLYRPFLAYAISYFRYDSSQTYWGANMSSWSSLTHWGQNQKQTATKYWVGYGNNRIDLDDFAWRTVTCNYSPTEFTQDFVMAPNATTKVSVWDYDNTTASSSADGSTAPTAVWVGSTTGGTNPSSITMTLADPFYSPDYTRSLPWVSTNNQYNDQVLSLNNSSVSPVAMKYGLPLAKVTKDCTLTYKINVKPGKIGFYVNTPKTYDSIDPNDKQDITEDKEITDTIELKNGDVLFVIYLPSGDSSRLDVTELYMEYES